MKKQRLGKKEIIAIIATIALMLILCIKSTLLDEVKNLTPAEQQFKDFVEYSIARDYSGALEKSPLLFYRVYKIEMADQEQKAVLKYQDPENGKQIEIVQDGRYIAGVRGYVFGLFPIKQFEVTAEIQK